MELSHWLKRVDQRLKQTGWNEAPIPLEFQEREGKAELRLRSSAWVSPAGSEAKCAYLCGPRAEILNLMIYPRHCVEVPVFAVELILFGQQPRVAVVDLQAVQGLAGNPGLGARLHTEMAPVHRQFSLGLGAGGDLPPWAEEHFTPWAIYSRPQSMAELPQILQAATSYLDLWLSRFYPDERATCSDQPALRQYQQHHLENTPGRRFLVTSFGSDWTEDYLARFMYPAGELVKR